MTFHLKYSQPDWLFFPAPTETFSASTVASFSPEEALKSDMGFKGRMIPDEGADERQKMTLLINDPTLRYIASKRSVEILVKHSGITRDHFVVVNFSKMDELHARMYPQEDRHKARGIGSAISLQWEMTRTLPMGIETPVFLDYKMSPVREKKSWNDLRYPSPLFSDEL